MARRRTAAEQKNNTLSAWSTGGNKNFFPKCEGFHSYRLVGICLPCIPFSSCVFTLLGHSARDSWILDQRLEGKSSGFVFPETYRSTMEGGERGFYSSLQMSVCGIAIY